MTRILHGESGGEVRTSVTDPLRVDFLGEQPWAGRLGLTFAPGKKNESYRHFKWDRDLRADLHRLVDEYGTDVLVTILEVEEMEWMRIADLREHAVAHGMESLWYPVEDLNAPGDEELPEFLAFLGDVLERLEGGRTVVVHCRGGLGRSGMVAACLLAVRDCEPERAIEVVRQARGPGAVEMPVQEDLVETVASGGGATSPAGPR
jgi:protein-tyrosine phosphatase